jgi:hypothetical protein
MRGLWCVGLVACLALALPPGVSQAATRVFAATAGSSPNWEPRPGMELRWTGSDSCHLKGRQEAQWSYARSADFALQAGHKYRVSGRVQVTKVDPAQPPSFKVEVTGGLSAQYTTTRYDLKKGGWQLLWGEFECPAGVTGGWTALEKGTNLPVTFEGEVKAVMVEEIDQFAVAQQYRFHPVPPGLARLAHTHPRLYLTQARLATLKGKLQQDAYAPLLARLLRLADRLAADGPPAYRDQDSYSGEEQLYQREVGNAIPELALAYVLTSEKRYLESAKAWMLASAGYPTWGLGSIDGMDLAAGHQLYGLALAYDWLYHDLDPATRDTVRACLQRRGQRMYERLVSGQVWWADAYLQNHQWVDMTGLAAAGMALYGEVPDVDGWMLVPLEKARVTMRSLGPDGASHEGVPYWSYGVEYLLKFMDLTRDLLGEDLFAHNAWFSHTASFRLYSMLPRASWREESDLMTFADGPRGDWYGPDYLLRKLAAEYHDGHAQWLANELDGADLSYSAALFLNLLWVDPSVPATPPTALPTFRHFSDLGLVYMRSSWSGDESMAAFKCGPAIGHHALALFDSDPGSGHVHPDSGSLLLFAHGDWLLVDDGYARKTTAYQNTVLVNGIGQEGEGEAWFGGERLVQEKRRPRILRAEHGRNYDYTIGDVTPAYRKEAGLTRFLRHVIYLRPDCWVLVDELTAVAPSTFELYFHADFPFTGQGEGAFLVKGARGAMDLTALGPGVVAARSWQQQLIGTGGEPGAKIEALTISNPAVQTRALFVTILNTRAADAAAPPRPTLQTEGERLVLTVGTGEADWRLALRPGRPDPATSLLDSVTEHAR